MNKEELENDVTIYEWLKSCKSEGTKESYVRSMISYTQFHGMTTEELLTEAENEVDDNIRMRRRKVNKRVTDFKNFLNNHVQKNGKQYAPKSIELKFSAVCTFYKFHDIEIKFSTLKALKTKKAHPLVEHQKIPTRDEVIHVLKYTESVRNKAIVSLGATSGLARSDIANLKVKDFVNGYDEVNNICVFENLIRVKTDVQFTTFCSPATCDLIHEYIKQRNEPHVVDKRKLEIRTIKYRINSGDDYLFIGDRINDTYLGTLNENDRKLDRKAIGTMYRKLSYKAKMSAAKGTWNLIRAHNIRAFFSDTLKNEVGMNNNYVEFLMGHEMSALEIAYSSRDLEKIKPKYLKALELLEVTEDAKLRYDNRELKIEKDETIEKLKNRLEKTELVTHDLSEQIIVMNQYEDEEADKKLKAANLHRVELMKELADLKKEKKVE